MLNQTVWFSSVSVPCCHSEPQAKNLGVERRVCYPTLKGRLPLPQNKKISKMKKVLDKMHFLCYTNSGRGKHTLTLTKEGVRFL